MLAVSILELTAS